MKNKLQIVTVILLVIAILFMGFLYAGQRRLEVRINGLSSSISNVQTNISNLNFQIENQNYIAINMRDEFPKRIYAGDTASGTIYFELTERKGIADMYVVIDSTDYEDSFKLEVEPLGNLKYKADVELDRITDYTYYVLGESKDGYEIMLSRKQNMSLMDRFHERAYYFPQESGFSEGISSNHFYVKGILQIDETELNVEKIELKLAKEEDFINFKEDDYEEYIIQTVDITDNIVPISKRDMEENVYFDDECYTSYSFDVSGELPEEIEFGPYFFYEYVVEITFTDGYVVKLFS